MKLENYCINIFNKEKLTFYVYIAELSQCFSKCNQRILNFLKLRMKQ